MAASLGAVVIGTPRPRELAAFYRDLLGWPTVADEPDWVRLRDPERDRPGLSFQLEPADSPPDRPATPGEVQMQAHLDVLVDDLDAEPAPGVRVLRDPHGHVFCLFLPGA